MAMEYLSPETAVILMGVSLVAGFIDAIAGGGGLLTIPALLAAGLPTASALATNKLQSPFGSFSASLNFIRKGYVSLGEMCRPSLARLQARLSAQFWCNPWTRGFCGL